MMRIAAFVLFAAMSLNAQFNVRRAPGFSLPDTNLKQQDLADYRGKVVVLDFMRTECPSCVQLSGILEQLKSKYADKIQVLSVVTAPPHNLDIVKKYIAANKVTSPFLFDCGQMTASYLQITPKNPTAHFPHVFVIDKTGMIRRDFSGEAASATNIIGAIEAALK
jgi:peroxiredoxin